jgi:hypothetical protein
MEKKTRRHCSKKIENRKIKRDELFYFLLIINELERLIQFSICNYKELLNFTILKNPNIYVDQSEYFGEITVKG